MSFFLGVWYACSFIVESCCHSQHLCKLYKWETELKVVKKWEITKASKVNGILLVTGCSLTSKFSINSNTLSVHAKRYHSVLLCPHGRHGWPRQYTLPSPLRSLTRCHRPYRPRQDAKKKYQLFLDATRLSHIERWYDKTRRNERVAMGALESKKRVGMVGGAAGSLGLLAEKRPRRA